MTNHRRRFVVGRRSSVVDARRARDGRRRARASRRATARSERAPRGGAEAPRARVGRRGRGTRTRRAGGSARASDARGRRARATERDGAWWKTLDDEACDPITLEPLRGMAYAPFEMEGAEGGGDGGDDARDARRGHMFDGAVLAEYVTRSRCFENPLTREAMDQRQCRALDAYLAKWKLKRFGVEKAFNAAAKEKREAELNAERRSEEQRLNMRRERDELRTTLAQTMFTSLRERASAERGAGAAARTVDEGEMNTRSAVIARRRRCRDRRRSRMRSLNCNRTAGLRSWTTTCRCCETCL